MDLLIEFDLTEVDRACQLAVQSAHGTLTTAVRNACRDGATAAVNGRLYQDRTANLTASIHGDEALVITHDGAEGQITAGMPYASYVNAWEEGQRSDGFLDIAERVADESLSERGAEDIAVAFERTFNGS